MIRPAPQPFTPHEEKIQKLLATTPTLLSGISGGTHTAEVTIGSRPLTLNALPGHNGLCESTGSSDCSNAAT